VELDPDVAAALRDVLGFPDAAEPPGLDLAAAAAVVQAAQDAAVLDGGSVVLTAVRLVWECKAGGGTAEAAREAIAAAPLSTQRDVLDVLTALVVFAGYWASDAELARAAELGADQP
jgi:hypothetical protein